ncbi:MAG: hypothetical protein SGILL_009587, partial [Bacillariaceae sp.]
RNLDLCGNDEVKKKSVQKEMEKLIAKALQEGNLQTKNWDAEPVVLSPSMMMQPQQQQKQQVSGGGGSYYGPGASTPASLPASNGGYYGPGASSVAPSSSNGSYYGHSSGASAPSHNRNQHQNNDAYSYYGNNNSSLSSSSPSNSYSPQNKKGNKKSSKKRQFQGNEDYLALPSMNNANSNNHNNKFKKQRSNQLVRQKEDNGMDASAAARAKRANRFGGAADEAIHLSYSTHDRYMGKAVLGGVSSSSAGEALTETDFEQMTVKGTCQVLEKQYLRLTAPPRPDRVRPLPILQQHLRNLKREYYHVLLSDDDGDDDGSDTALLNERERTPQDEWKYNGSKYGNCDVPKRRHDYLWFCSQLKAVRQDCTVQRIQGKFAVDVYECHARIALQEGDLNEGHAFHEIAHSSNQCQTQLKELYKTVPSTADDSKKTDGATDDNTTTQPTADDDGHTAATPSSSSSWENEDEFIAYRLLYYVYLSTNDKYSGGSSDMFQIMLSLASSEKKKQQQNPAIAHALQVREAVACSDYYRFFRYLHSTTTTSPSRRPNNNNNNLGVFLTDLLVPVMRMRGLRRIAKAYRPSVELNLCLKHLGLISYCDDDDSSDAEEEKAVTSTSTASAATAAIERGTEWVTSCGAVVKDGKFLTKDSEVHEPVTDKKNSLI